MARGSMSQPQTRSMTSGKSASSSSLTVAILPIKKRKSVMAASSQASSIPSVEDSPSGVVILAAIKECKETLTEKIGSMSTDISLIRQDMDKFRSRVSEVEARVSTLEEKEKDLCRF